ncbi:hypothetical protein C0J52_07589 [Blattella germanica]|nr:hypothetical protein C0J52_07589 [Blattella germanica]
MPIQNIKNVFTHYLCKDLVSKVPDLIVCDFPSWGNKESPLPQNLQELQLRISAAIKSHPKLCWSRCGINLKLDNGSNTGMPADDLCTGIEIEIQERSETLTSGAEEKLPLLL